MDASAAPATEVLPRLPFERPNVLDIAPMYRMLQAETPLTRVRTQAGDLAWLATGYAEVKALAADPRLGRSHPDPGRAARISHSAILGGPIGSHETEQADHARMRRLGIPAFSARRMGMLRERVQHLFDVLLDQLADMTPPVNLRETLSSPFPALVICELLGVPYVDRDQARTMVNEMSDTTDEAGSAAVFGELFAYMRQLIACKREDPGEDVISDLIAAQCTEGNELTDDDIAGLGVALLFGGHETTVTYIDFGVLWLLTCTEARKALLTDPGLAPSAVEEILRLTAPVSCGLLRYARADITMGDVTIQAGDAVLLAHVVADRDATVFPDPDLFDITRQPNPHLGFGHGGYFCLGASLAGMMLRVAFSTLFQRFPTLRLAVPVEQLQLHGEPAFESLVELPVTW